MGRVSGVGCLDGRHTSYLADGHLPRGGGVVFVRPCLLWYVLSDGSSSSYPSHALFDIAAYTTIISR